MLFWYCLMWEYLCSDSFYFDLNSMTWFNQVEETAWNQESDGTIVLMNSDVVHFTPVPRTGSLNFSFSAGYQCPVCSKTFIGRNYKQDYVRHYQSIHLKLRQYPCRKCGKMFAYTFNRNRHMKRNCKGWRVDSLIEVEKFCGLNMAARINHWT